MTNQLTAFDEKDRLIATTLRMLAADAVQQANSGHPGLPLGAADIGTALWTRALKHNPAHPTWANRDRFILSAGHGSTLLYGLLHLFGYPMPLDEIKKFRQWNSLTPGHPEYDLKLGIETTTGPLGQGFGNAVGIALAECWLAARFNKPDFPIVDHFTYVLASDGDLEEGVSHETASLAGHWGLGKLIVLYDDNHISIDGPTDLSFSENIPQRFAAYNWHTQQVDGHDLNAVHAAIRAAQAETDRPSIIACRTHIGLGSPKQDTSKVHGEPLGEDALKATKEHYKWQQEPRFFIPNEIHARLDQVRAIGAARETEWNALLANYRAQFPDLAAQWDLYIAGKLPPGWEAALPIIPSDKPLATRAASGFVLDAIIGKIPTLLGGSADLTPSNNTKTKDAKHLKRGDFSGTYIHFGIREHAMGGIMNGLALHGLRPYGGTFLVFSDYMRPTIRLAAFMGLPVIYVFTHDSIGLGEDGPTHQPTEHITALRAIPNLVVIRPADGNETVQAWKVALERRDGPTALILSRQIIAFTTPVQNDLARGAYVIADDPTPRLILIATGSEVPVALDARKKLAEQGIAARVVSMPSWELFDAQSREYRDSVLLPGVPRLAIEAGVTLAWGRYVGANGKVIGLDRYGASGPFKTLFQELGFNADNVVQHAREMLR
ncbi:MAG: transketolase [Chloroflexi bacterium]|nr:transketolase [Chloroflexota bacterium]